MEAKTTAERLKILEDNSFQTLTDMKELKLALLGSKKLRLKGALDYVQEHEDYIQKEKKRKYYYAGAVGVIVFLISVFGPYIAKLIFGP